MGASSWFVEVWVNKKDHSKCSACVFVHILKAQGVQENNDLLVFHQQGQPMVQIACTPSVTHQISTQI